MRRAVTRVTHAVGTHRVLVTADRGLADVARFSTLQQLAVRCIMRVQASTNVAWEGRWHRRSQIRFRGNERDRSLGARYYCETTPQRLWISTCRARDARGNWGMWHLVSNHPSEAKTAAQEDGRRFGCEAGLRDTTWWLGCAKARITQIKAWSRMFALFAIALLLLQTVGSVLLLGQGVQGGRLLRRVASRRRARCELGLVSAMVSLLQQDQTLYEGLCPRSKLKLDATLANVS